MQLLSTSRVNSSGFFPSSIKLAKQAPIQSNPSHTPRTRGRKGYWDGNRTNSLDDLHGDLDVASLGVLLHRVELRHQRVPAANETITNQTLRFLHPLTPAQEGGEGDLLGESHRRWRRGSWEAELKEETLRLSWWRSPSVLCIEAIISARFCFDASSALSPPPPACTPFPAAAAAAATPDAFVAAPPSIPPRSEKTREREREKRDRDLTCRPNISAAYCWADVDVTPSRALPEAHGPQPPNSGPV